MECDLHQVYGVDCESGVLRERTWRWLQVRVTGLFTTEDTRLRRYFYPDESTTEQPGRAELD